MVATTTYKQDELDKVIKSVLSPGTFFQNQTARAFRMPTGERGRSFLQTYVWEETLVPDANGQIILASLPFYETPFVRIVKTSRESEDIQSITAKRPDAIAKFTDWMKENKIYAWRMNCQSVTVRFTGNMTNQAGNVVAATMQPSIDNKVRLTETGGMDSYARTLDRIPVTEQGVQSQARSFYTGNSVDGVYLVNRHVDANLPFTTRNSDQAKAYAGFWKSEITYKPNYGYFATDSSSGILIADDAGTGIALTAPSCTDIGVVLFSGGNADQSYRAKFVISCEFMIKPGSPFASQCDPIPPRNFQFLQALSRAASKSNYGNADSNSWGSLFSGLKKAWDFVNPIVEIASDLVPPQYAAPLKTITTVSKKLQDAANKVAKAQAPATNQQAITLPMPPIPSPRSTSRRGPPR